jgi:hypothetical protein
MAMLYLPLPHQMPTTSFIEVIRPYRQFKDGVELDFLGCKLNFTNYQGMLCLQEQVHLKWKLQTLH